MISRTRRAFRGSPGSSECLHALVACVRARAAAPQPWHHATVQRRQFNFASPKEYYWCLLFSCQGGAKKSLSLCNSLGAVQRVLSSAYDRYPTPSAPPCLETPDLLDAIGSRPTGHGPVTWLDGYLRPSLVMAKNARSRKNFMAWALAFLAKFSRMTSSPSRPPGMCQQCVHINLREGCQIISAIDVLQIDDLLLDGAARDVLYCTVILYQAHPVAW